MHFFAVNTLRPEQNGRNFADNGSTTGKKCSHALSLFNALRPQLNDGHFADDILKCILCNENF